MLWNRRVDVLILSVIAEKLVEYVVGERGLVLQEDLERLLHSIEGCWFPNELDGESAVGVGWGALLILDLKTYLLGLGNFDDVTFAFQEIDPITSEDYKVLDGNRDQVIGF